jgi:hypothetical protein
MGNKNRKWETESGISYISGARKSILIGSDTAPDEVTRLVTSQGAEGQK